MKIIMYISGITGILLLALRLLGTVMDFRENELMLIGGLILVGVVFIPLLLIDRHRHNKKIDNIIKSYEGREQEVKEIPKSGKGSKGWGMNNSPFRERRSGLSWGGGNVKAAEATRGTRRKFLKK
ncbi:hypothetical protein ES705_23120 [subsurface metagenome]